MCFVPSAPGSTVEPSPSGTFLIRDEGPGATQFSARSLITPSCAFSLGPADLQGRGTRLPGLRPHGGSKLALHAGAGAGGGCGPCLPLTSQVNASVSIRNPVTFGGPGILPVLKGIPSGWRFPTLSDRQIAVWESYSFTQWAGPSFC